MSKVPTYRSPSKVEDLRKIVNFDDEYNHSLAETKDNRVVVEYTISQDLAAGHSAEQEKNLQHFLKSDDSSLLGSSSNRLGSNHAWQDYQMQLMLLEQQHKKRLFLARTEQDNLVTMQDQSSRHTEQLNVSRKRLRTDPGTKQCYTSKPPIASKYGGNTPVMNDNSDTEEREIHAPHLFFFHHRQRLRQYAADNGNISPQVTALLDYILRLYGGDYDEADMLFARDLVTRHSLSLLFMPNEIVASTDQNTGEPAAYVVRKWPTFNADGTLVLDCWFWIMDGVGLARKQCSMSVPRLAEGTEFSIGTLPVIPFRFLDQESRLRLKHRGQKHWALSLQTYVTYQGWNVSKDQFYPDSTFMIDHRTYKRMHSISEAFQFIKPDILPFDPRPPRIPRDAVDDGDFSMLLPPDTHGFYFNEKKWLNIYVDGIQPVKWNKSAFDRLVLPPQTKEVIRALVTVRTSQRGVKHGLGLAGKRENIISGKGNGLIMLLHGGPGTGKSLTAAEIAEMPLYRVTCGDVGTSADVVERYLHNVLTLGKEWNCVLLLDEADVFLEERSMSDLKRNSLVSVFLRILEYYDGILMLTSNRVGTFDEAFKSRIQVALYYKTLNRSSRRKIWHNFLEMLEEDNENVDFKELHSHLDELAGHELNGRQIRNALTTARQLAIYKKEQLEWGHLEHALSLSTEFNDYLKRVQGHTDDQWATEERIRLYDSVFKLYHSVEILATFSKWTRGKTTPLRTIQRELFVMR
ncbi:hypothetical protein MMC18_007291 [Xylographa bjoerkii]|nr:hypothetical protein [Xylographa bjoerkii]